jgi:hypothetical protein
MLRGLDCGAFREREGRIQCSQLQLHVAVPAQLSEPVTRVAEGAGHPAQGYLAVHSRLDVTRVEADRAVEVLDRVGGAQCAVQRAADAQAMLGQCDHAALGDVPRHRATLASTLLGAGQLLRRQHQLLLDQRNGSLLHRLVDARPAPLRAGRASAAARGRCRPAPA